MNDPEYAGKLDEIARIAVRRQYYILRRSWGIYYAIWASGFTFMLLASMIVFTFVSGLKGYLILLSLIFFIVLISGYLSRGYSRSPSARRIYGACLTTNILHGLGSTLYITGSYSY